MPFPFPSPETGEEGVPLEGEPAPPKPENDPSTPAFRQAVELQKKGKWAAAQKAFRKIQEDFPNSLHQAEIEHRAGDNAILGVEVLHESGPAVRRIDVSVMGDGFTIDAPDQVLQEKWAKLCLDVLFSEDAYSEYKDYFNYYFVRLASLEEGVDPNLSPEEKAKILEKNKTRTKKKKTDFSTALDCKAAGPQGQVMADRRLVNKWLKIAADDVPGCRDDGLVIAFARFGVLGMGGGGIANVGRPDKSVTVHEFGHAFVGLLDEYAVNPMAPREPIRAANASTSSDPEQVPWAHFLRKKVPGVGLFEGGATYKKGVFRPAQGCAMNSAGNTGYCPVCREATVLRIYANVSPIDVFEPAANTELRVKEGAANVLAVTPMAPKKHSLTTTWYVEAIDATAPGPDAEPAEPSRTGPEPGRRRRAFDDALLGRFRGGKRGREDRSAYGAPPPGAPSSLGIVRKGDAKRPTEHHFPVGRLKPGRYRVTAVVKDPTSWVLEDPDHLLEERVRWFVSVDAAR